MAKHGIGPALLIVLLVALLALAGPARALAPEVLDSVVSVLPVWPGHAQGGQRGGAPTQEPEGSAVAVRAGGYLATALHIVDRAERVSVRLADGRVLPAEVVGSDRATDLAVLRVAADLPAIAIGPEPALAQPVCAIGNQFGLGLSVTCGVVSALHRAGVGFNPIEDFVQTDAVVNPGASGGALVDRDGRLVGLLSAIFTKQSDADIGVNFAVSTALLLRVVDDLIDRGRVTWMRPGMRLEELPLADRAQAAGVRVVNVAPDAMAARAGVQAGDVIVAIAGRPVRSKAAALSAIQVRRPGDRLAVDLLRDGAPQQVELVLEP
jgi:S1-C subfamily serine protease